MQRGNVRNVLVSWALDRGIYLVAGRLTSLNKLFLLMLRVIPFIKELGGIFADGPKMMLCVPDFGIVGRNEITFNAVVKMVARPGNGIRKGWQEKDEQLI